MEHDAVAALYATHAAHMLAFFTRRTYDAQTAMDLVGETFARAYAGRARVRGTDPAAWVWGIAHNVLHDAHRWRAAESRALRRLGVERVELSDDEARRVEEEAGLDALRDRLAAALDLLSDDQRDALRLRIVHELDYPTVAQRLGVSQATARARVSRGLRALAGVLGRAEAEA